MCLEYSESYVNIHEINAPHHCPSIFLAIKGEGIYLP